MIQVVELERFAISVILAEAFEARNARSLSVTAFFGHFHGWHAWDQGNQELHSQARAVALFMRREERLPSCSARRLRNKMNKQEDIGSTVGSTSQPSAHSSRVGWSGLLIARSNE